VTDQVSHPHKTIGKIIVPYICFFTFSERKREDKRLWANQKVAGTPAVQTDHNFYMKALCFTVTTSITVGSLQKADTTKVFEIQCTVRKTL
jgi:hypothetical protein